MVKEIFLGLHSEEYAELVHEQVEEDGGFDRSSIALFGEPGSGKFEFVLTGRPSPGVATATRSKAPPSEDRFSMATQPEASPKKPTTLETFIGFKPNGPTNSIKRWTGNNARSPYSQREAVENVETRPSKQKAPPRISTDCPPRI